MLETFLTLREGRTAPLTIALPRAECATLEVELAESGDVWAVEATLLARIGVLVDRMGVSVGRRRGVPPSSEKAGGSERDTGVASLARGDARAPARRTSLEDLASCHVAAGETREPPGLNPSMTGASD